MPDVTNSLSKMVGNLKPQAYAQVQRDKAVFSAKDEDVKELIKDRLSKAIDRFEEGALLQANLARSDKDKDKDGNVTKRTPFFLTPRKYEVLNKDSLQWNKVLGCSNGLVIGLPPASFDSESD